MKTNANHALRGLMFTLQSCRRRSNASLLIPTAMKSIVQLRFMLCSIVLVVLQSNASATTIDFSPNDFGAPFLPLVVQDALKSSARSSINNGVLFSEISGGPAAATWDDTGGENLNFGSNAVVRMEQFDASLFNLNSLDITFRNSLDGFGTFDVVSSKGASQSIASLGTHTFSGAGFQNVEYVDFTLVKGGFFADKYNVDNIVLSATTIDFSPNDFGAPFLPLVVQDALKSSARSSINNGVLFSEISGGPAAATWDDTGGENLNFGSNAVVRMEQFDASLFNLNSLDITFRNSLDGFGTFDVVSSKGASQSIASLGPHAFSGAGFQNVEYVDFTLVKGGFFADNYNVDNIVLQAVPEPTILTELLIDSPPVTLNITGNVDIAAGAEVGVTPDYSQAPATIESILAVTHTGTRIGEFANEGEHLRDGLFVDTITYNPNDIIVDLLQAGAGDLNGDRLVDATDIQLILAANSFNNPAGGPYTWLEGDNNGDGLVNSTDIQNILAANLFGAGAYAALPSSAAAVPEPSSLVLAVFALVGLIAYSWRKRR